MLSEPPLNVLLVDDEPANLLAYEAILQGLDANLVRAGSGAEALRYLLEHDVAVILMDVRMPGMNGLETATLIRQRHRSRQTPLIFITAAYKDDFSKFAGYALGAVDYLEKPVAPAILRSKVTVFVDLFRKSEQLKRQAQELRLANDAADSANQANQRTNEFLAMLAHELRNPLAPALNALEMMRLNPADSAACAWARDMAEKQIGHLTRLVDDLLDVSRIIHGRIQLRKEIVDLAQVVTQAVDSVRPLIDNRGQELCVALPPEPVLLEADPTRLVQVLNNLLNNAMKYTQDAGRIRLTAERDGREVVLRVRDTGMGMAAELLPRVFDLFTQGERGLDRSQGGLGIGLTMVRRLVEMHGGAVAAHSNGPAQGSEFIVRLPVLPQAPPPGPDSSGSPPRQAPQQPGVSPARRVLVVDDSIGTAQSMAALLQLKGHDVRVAFDGPTALETAAVFHPDVVLLDIGMPEMNGYQVAKQLRQMPGLEQTLLVALSGYGQEEDRSRSREAGFQHHLVKPVGVHVVEELLVSAGCAP